MTIPTSSQLVVFYLLLAYLVPAVLVSIFSVHQGGYRAVPVNWIALAILLAVIAAHVTVTGAVAARRERTAPRRYDFRFIPTSWQVAILSVLVAVSAGAYALGLNRWRYSDTGLSEGSVVGLVYAGIPQVFQFFVLIYVFYDRRFADGHGVGHVLTRILVSAGLLLSANGITTMLVATVGSALMLSPTLGRALLFRRKRGARSSVGAFMQRWLGFPTLLVALIAMVALAWVLGESVKRGQVQSVLEVVTVRELSDWIDWIVWRSAPSYYSLLVALDDFALATDWHVVSEHFGAPVRTFLYRADYLLGGMFNVSRPESGTIMRINYELIFQSPSRVRVGSSPGLIAGFLYSFPLPLNFLALMGYLFFLQRFLSRLAAGLVGQLGIFGKLSMLYLLLPLFTSPIDLLLILDTGTISLVLLLWLRQVLLRDEPRRGITQPIPDVSRVRWRSRRVRAAGQRTVGSSI